jgi:hypothetical protein
MSKIYLLNSTLLLLIRSGEECFIGGMSTVFGSLVFQIKTEISIPNMNTLAKFDIQPCSPKSTHT